MNEHTDEGEIYTGSLFNPIDVIYAPDATAPIVELYRFEGYSVVLYVPTMVMRKFIKPEKAREYAAEKTNHAMAIMGRFEGWFGDE